MSCMTNQISQPGPDDLFLFFADAFTNAQVVALGPRTPAPRHKSASVRARFNLVLSRRGSDTAAGVSGIQRGTARAGRRHDALLRQ